MAAGILAVDHLPLPEQRPYWGKDHGELLGTVADTLIPASAGKDYSARPGNQSFPTLAASKRKFFSS